MEEVATRPAAEEQPDSRQNSRLNQGIGFSAVIIFSVSSIGLGYSGLLPFSTLPGVFPGANLPLMLLVMLAMGCLLASIYSTIGVIAPRYGADYHLASRVVSAPLSFAGSFTAVITLSLVSGSLLASIFIDIVPSFIKTLATITYNQDLLNRASVVSEPYAVTLSGTSLLILVFLLLILPPKLTHRFLLAGFILALAAWGLLLFQLASAVPGSFETGWNRFMGADSYAQQILVATQQGMKANSEPGVALLAGFALSFWLYYGYLTPVYFAAEVKAPQKNMLRGSLAALGVCFIIIFLSVYLLQRLVPLDWVGAVSYLYLSGTTSNPIMPSLPFFALIARPDPLAAWFVGVVWMLSVLNMALAFLYSCSRAILAWVRDHILPERVGFVHPQLHSPVISVLLICALAEFGIVITALNRNIFSSFFPSICLAFVIILPVLAYTILPFTKKEWFSAAPGILTKKIGQIPLMTIQGSLMLISIVGILAANLWMKSLAVPALSSILTLALVFITGLLWFLIRRYSLRTNGEDIDLQFRQL